ncbi:MAG: tRNA lysidine(34) synthetase TilS [Sphingobium sp.]
MTDGPARFRGAVERLTGSVASGRLGVAVSGGPDSMALLWLAQAAFPGQVEAATIDHGLRAASADEAAMVAAYCEGRGIAHRILRPDSPITGNLQSAARNVRYMLLETWRQAQSLDWLLTAHHADDQLETVLMRLNRGSGVSGLAGVRARSGVILRPLLGWRKEELEALAEGRGIPFVHDPSNADDRFDRAALRKALAGADWLDPVAAAHSAAALAEAEEALQWVVGDLTARHVEEWDGGWRLTATKFPREVQRRLVLHMLRIAAPEEPAPRGEALDAALVQLEAGRKTMLGDWLLRGGESWTLRRAPPRRR